MRVPDLVESTGDPRCDQITRGVTGSSDNALPIRGAVESANADTGRIRVSTCAAATPPAPIRTFGVRHADLGSANTQFRRRSNELDLLIQRTRSCRVAHRHGETLIANGTTGVARSGEVHMARRLMAAALALAMTCLLATACGDDPPPVGAPTGPPREPTLTPPTEALKGVRFRASAKVSEDTLTIDYEIINDGNRAIVAFNRVPSTDSPNPEPGDPEAFYVEPSGPGVRLSKQVYRAPEGVAMAARFVLRGTIVAPGERLREHIVTGTTFKTRRPYQGILGYEPRMLEAGPVTVCVGVALADKLTPLSDDAHPTYAHDTPTANQQHLLCS